MRASEPPASCLLGHSASISSIKMSDAPLPSVSAACCAADWKAARSACSASPTPPPAAAYSAAPVRMVHMRSLGQCGKAALHAHTHTRAHTPAPSRQKRRRGTKRAHSAASCRTNVVLPTPGGPVSSAACANGRQQCTTWRRQRERQRPGAASRAPHLSKTDAQASGSLPGLHRQQQHLAQHIARLRQPRYERQRRLILAGWRPRRQRCRRQRRRWQRGRERGGGRR